MPSAKVVDPSNVVLQMTVDKASKSWWDEQDWLEIADRLACQAVRAHDDGIVIDSSIHPHLLRKLIDEVLFWRRDAIARLGMIPKIATPAQKQDGGTQGPVRSLRGLFKRLFRR